MAGYGALLVLVISLGTVMWVRADYHIGFTISGYSNPNNTLSNGSCCDGTCTAGSCRTTLRLCFRNTGHSRSDVESNCIQQIDRSTSGFFSVIATNELPIEQYYSGMFQLYIRVSHSLNETVVNADFDPPFTDPLIDNIFIEANVNATLIGGSPMPVTYPDVMGELKLASITQVTINIVCAQNYFGEACEMLCNPDGSNCSTVLIPPPAIGPTTAQPDPTGTTTNQPDTTGTTTDQPDTTGSTTVPSDPASTAAVVSDPTPNVVGIVVGVVVGVAVLICIGVGIVILIIYLVKMSKKGSWNPKKSDLHFTLERAERNLTSSINRISIISEDGHEVQYAIVSKPNSPARTPRQIPSPPPPYVPPMQGEELDTEDEEGPMEATPAKRSDQVNKSSSTVAGYEIVDFPNPKEQDQDSAGENGIMYASLNVHSNGNGHVPIIKMPEPDDDDHEPIQYTELQHQDS